MDINLESCTVISHTDCQTILRTNDNKYIIINKDGNITTSDVPITKSTIMHISKNYYRVYAPSGSYAEVTAYPNQKIVQIFKCRPKGYIIDIPTNKKAMETLSCSAFVLYQHFVQSTPEFVETLSSQYMIEHSGLTERKYKSAIDELIKYNYLVKQCDCGNVEFYCFYESPSLQYTNQGL